MCKKKELGLEAADTPATQAQEQANAATAQAEQVSAQAQVMSDQVDQVIDKMSPAMAAARGAGGPTLDASVAADPQRIRDGLRARYLLLPRLSAPSVQSAP